MGGQLNIPVLRTFVILASHVQGLGNAVLERVSQVIIRHTVGFRDLLTFPEAGNGIGTERGAEALDNIRHVDVQRQGTTVNKRKVQIRLSVFTIQVFLHRNVGFLRHLFRCQAFDFAKLTDSACHLLDLIIQCSHTVHTVTLLLGNEKTPVPK